jgi:hypothetical protein
MRAYYTVLYMLIKMLQPFNSKLICCPAIVADYNSPIARYIVALVPSREVVLTHEDNERQDCPPSCVDSLDYYSPLAITWLYRLWLITLL